MPKYKISFDAVKFITKTIEALDATTAAAEAERLADEICRANETYDDPTGDGKTDFFSDVNVSVVEPVPERKRKTR